MRLAVHSCLNRSCRRYINAVHKCTFFVIRRKFCSHHRSCIMNLISLQNFSFEMSLLRGHLSLFSLFGLVSSAKDFDHTTKDFSKGIHIRNTLQRSLKFSKLLADFGPSGHFAALVVHSFRLRVKYHSEELFLSCLGDDGWVASLIV